LGGVARGVGAGGVRESRDRKGKEPASTISISEPDDDDTPLAAKLLPKKKQELKRIAGVAGVVPEAGIKRKAASESDGDGSKRGSAAKKDTVTQGGGAKSPGNAKGSSRGAGGKVTQCEGETKAGERCKMSSTSSLAIADPLRNGGKFCSHHCDQTKSPGTGKGISRPVEGKVSSKIDSDKSAKTNSAPSKAEDVWTKRRKRDISQAPSDEDEAAVPQDSPPPSLQSENTAHPSTGGKKPTGWKRGADSVEAASISSSPSSFSSFGFSSDDM